MNHSRTRVAALMAASIAALLALTGCAAFSMTAEELARALHGTQATFHTYDKSGNVMGNVVGTSVRVTSDKTFDDFNGESTNPAGCTPPF